MKVFKTLLITLYEVKTCYGINCFLLTSDWTLLRYKRKNLNLLGHWNYFTVFLPETHLDDITLP